MKYILLSFLFISGIGLASCNKDFNGASNESNAVITGYDFSECSCCGGYMISMVNSTQYNGKNFLAAALPGNYQDITPQSSIYPIYVNIKWYIDSTKCNNRYIVVTEMTKK